MRVLVTGGVRSGKSRHAEALLSEASAVTYVAPGPVPDAAADHDWAARVAGHRARRPGGWTTVETRDLAGALTARTPVLVDCLGTWVTGVLDDRGLWERPADEVTALLADLAEEVAAAIQGRDDVVLVTNEVGLGVVPAHRSGRLFRDLLGLVNQRIGAAVEEVHLVVAGRVLRL
ncbi:bifunctional adenosylcobinamide kinase/adenosylcobinamide-phosphate guanylyltransferase [Nocardioides ferulae]|uniref:bifunctional adenosylcobinamide kinase/adenosylcobinamide-phosphate guanylyltransferase n=1 Tax=Nocardioides ferulae TaxID=2340821 RepID=UPI000EAF72BF|nr:bifunctional adenosylcobinamide kinase/adenosylcobinamide-phosphate guanylyltransferase [Nocardioides ferulae]